MSAPVPFAAFELLRPLARGGMGEVWLGRHAPSGTPVAVKLLAAEQLAVPHVEHALTLEIQAVASLDHPNVIRVHDQGRVPEAAERATEGRLRAGTPYVVLEFCDGGTLRQRVKHLDWRQARGVLLDLLSALAHAHARGVVHRDLKAANVLFGGDRSGLKLTDFGMVLPTSPGAAFASGGTPAYMAPEQFSGRPEAQGPWTDLYALGCLAYLLTTRRLPFPGRTWDEFHRQHAEDPIPSLDPAFAVPEWFDEWVATLMAKDPAHRFPSAAEAARALRDLTRSRPGPRFSHWRTMDRSAPPRHLAGAGLGLYALRARPLVGRTAERDALWAALRHVSRAGEPVPVVLTGPPGMGKRHLARWLCEQAAELGVAVPVRVPLEGGVGRGLASALGTYGLPAEAVRARLAETTHLHGQASPQDLAALAELVAPGADPVVRFGGFYERYVLARRVLERLASVVPVVLWIESADQAEDALLFAHHLARHPVPALIVCTADDGDGGSSERELLDDLAKLPRASRLPLGPLADSDHLVLVHQLVDLDPTLAEQVVRRTRGSPRLAVERIEGWVERGFLTRGPEGFTWAGEAAEVEGDREFWSDRLRRALSGRPPQERVALQLAAVLGQAVRAEDWSRACAAANVGVPWASLPALAASGLIVVDRGAGPVDWAFRQASVAAVLVGWARDEGRLGALHVACAAALGNEANPDDRARRGRHLLAAGRHDAAVDELLAAAKGSQSAGEHRAALRALDAVDEAVVGLPAGDERRGRAWLLRVQALRGAGRLDAVAEPLEKLRIGARTHRWPEMRAWASFLDGLVAWDRGDLVYAEEAVAAAWAEAPTGSDVRGFAATALGEARIALGDLQGGEQQLLRCVEEVPDPSDIEAFLGLAYVALQQGRNPEALRWVAEAHRVAERTGSRRQLAHYHDMHAEVLRAGGEPAVAESHYREAWRLFDAIGSFHLWESRLNLALCLLELERWAEARAHFEAVVAATASAAPGLAAVAHVGLVASVPEDEGEGGEWAAELALGRRMLAETGLVAADVARLAMLAADRVASAEGAGEVARGALELALGQWTALGDAMAAEGVRRRLEGC